MTAEEAISERVAPIGQVNMEGPMLAAADAGGTGAAAADDGEPQSAKEIYSGVCAACHDNGVAGAPELGDTGTWQSRLDERGSYDALYQNALNGLGAMPAKGGANISEEELDETVRYILEESGLSP
jgi:cytochrome c5